MTRHRRRVVQQVTACALAGWAGPWRHREAVPLSSALDFLSSGACGSPDGQPPAKRPANCSSVKNMPAKGTTNSVSFQSHVYVCIVLGEQWDGVSENQTKNGVATLLIEKLGKRNPANGS